MPKISYDFQAPLGEFGLEHGSYRYLRTIHSFLADFGDQLAPMEVVLPENWKKMTPENRDDLRYAARMRDGKGFLFLVNFQDHDTARHDMKDIALEIDHLRIPAKGSFTLPKDESVILPFNMPLGSITLKYAIAQPLMKIKDGNMDHYIFFAPDGMQPEYMFDAATVKGSPLKKVKAGLGSTFAVVGKDGVKIKITTLTNLQALDAIKVNDKLLITKATVLPAKEGTTLQQLSNPTFSYILYPSAKGWKEQKKVVQAVNPECQVSRVGTRRLSVHFRGDSISAPQVSEYFMKVDYVGDVAMAFLNGRMVQDEFWHGTPWMIGLDRHQELMKTNDMSFYFRPINSNHECLQDLPREVLPDFSKSTSVLDIKGVSIVPQYQVKL